MKELRFYIGDVAVRLYETYAGAEVPLDRIEIQESDNFDTGYTTIESYPAGIKNEYLTTKHGSDTWVQKWYRIHWLSKDGTQIFGDSGPIVPEEIQRLLDDVRMHMGDTNIDNPAWSDREYVQHIRFALKQYKGSANIATVKDEDIIPVVLLCRIAFANILSYDYAKYYALQAPGATLDKSQIHSHYSQVARDLQDSYDNIARRLGLSEGGQNDGHHITTMPAPLEGDTERWSNFRNGFVKLRPGVINTGTRNTQSQRFFQEPSGW